MRNRILAGAALLFIAAVTIQCNRQPAAPAASAVDLNADLKPVVSIRELMQNIVDPLSDNIFDAVAVDVTEKGVVETKPETDEDWARVKQGAVALAEATNLLMIPRRVAPENDNVAKNPGELPPDEVMKKIQADRAKWLRHVNDFRATTLKVFDIVEKRDTDALFNVGTDIDKACESCHLEYWYPGDREAVEKDRNSAVTYEKPQNAVPPAPAPTTSPRP
jgi:hypothetical protein